MLPHEPTWATVGLFSAGSVAIGAFATASIITALNRRNARTIEPQAKRQKLTPPSPEKPQSAEPAIQDAAADVDQIAAPAQPREVEVPEPTPAAAEPADDAPETPDAEAHAVAYSDSVVDLQKLQELEQRVADLNALAELGKVYQDSLALSAQLRNLSSFRLQQDKVLGRGSLAVVQEGEYAGDSVAVKLLPIGSVFAEDSRKEACLALCLHHPNIVRVVGVHLVEVESKPYLALVQEAAPGGDLGWQIEDCDFHTGRRGSASMDVAIKLLLDAARGLAYMHDVDVVHGDVKSRNLLVFWEEDEQSDSDHDDADAATATAAAAAGSNTGIAANGDSITPNGVADPGPHGTAAAAAGGGGESSTSDDKELVWCLKWCDFGVSYRAAEVPGGVNKLVTGTPGFRAPEVMDVGWSKAADTYAFGVIAWQLLTGGKPIIYDREWRMHVPNPDSLRVDRAGGVDEVPRALADLVWDCGAYYPKDRLRMREVVQRLEDIALQRLQKQEAAEAEKLKQQHAAAEAQKVADQQAAAAETAAKQDLAAGTDQDPAAAAAAGHLHRAHTCPTCNQPNPLPHHGYGGLARAMSIAAREAAAGGAAADAAAAAHFQQVLQKGVAASPPAAAAEASDSLDRPGVDRTPSKRSIDALRQGSFEPGGSQSFSGRHHYEVLIQNDDDPITAEAVAHTLDQYAGSSLSSKIFSGHPQALQVQHHQVEQQHQQQGEADLPRQQQQQRVGSAASLQHCATAPVHSHLLDTAADVASAAADGEATAAAAAAVSGPPAYAHSRSTATPASPAPLNITGAVSRSNIELLPAQGPGLIRVSASPATAAQGLAAAAAVSPTAAAAGSGGGGAPSGWYLASGSSFKKGMWLEKLPGSPAAAAAGGPDANTFLSPSAPSPAAAACGAGGGPRSFSSDSAFGGVPMSPSAAAWLQSPRSQISPDRSLPDAAAAAAMSSGSFSLQLRREPANTLPAVAEGEGHDGTDSPAAAAAGRSGGTPPGGSNGAVDLDAIRLLRRQHTTRRLGTDVLAAAGALSKALSAMTAASQTLAISNTAAAGHNPPATAAAAGSGGSTGAAAAEVAGSNLLLTQDFVAAARGLSEALAALLPSAAALADVAPDQGAAAAAAASEAVQGLKDLQGQIRSAAAAAAAVSPQRRQQQQQNGCGIPTEMAGSLGDATESAFASQLSQFAQAAAHGIDIPAVNGHSPAAAVAAAEERRNSQSITGCDLALSPPPAACPPPVGDNISRSINLGSLFSSLGTDSFEHSLMTPTHGLGRRHSVDCSRPSFALAAAAAAGNARSDSPQPVLMRMPSQRKSLLSQELGRQ